VLVKVQVKVLVKVLVMELCWIGLWHLCSASKGGKGRVGALLD
jgi:hypothetical protein